MKKILLISNYKPGTGGISGQVELLSKHLQSEQIPNEIFSTKGSVFYRLRAYFLLLKKGSSYDVFHIHACSGWGFLPAIFGVWAGKRLHKRIVLTYHGGGAEAFFEKHRRLVCRYLLRTDVNIVLSGFLGKIFERFELPYTIVPNIIKLNTSAFRNRETIQAHFVSIRSLTPLYNIECILKAFKMVQQQLPQATLTIVGDGPSRKSLEEFARREGLKQLSFIGKVDNSAIYQYLDKSDILLSAPRIDNMPVSLLEGFNAGLLVISSRVGGIPYMIEDGVNGLLFESDNEKELAEKIIWAVEHTDLSRQIIISAHDDLKKYTWNSVKKELFVAYEYQNDVKI